VLLTDLFLHDPHSSNPSSFSGSDNKFIQLAAVNYGTGNNGDDDDDATDYVNSLCSCFCRLRLFKFVFFTLHYITLHDNDALCVGHRRDVIFWITSILGLSFCVDIKLHHIREVDEQQTAVLIQISADVNTAVMKYMRIIRICALILLETSALCKLFTFLLTYVAQITGSWNKREMYQLTVKNHKSPFLAVEPFHHSLGLPWPLRCVWDHRVSTDANAAAWRTNKVSLQNLLPSEWASDYSLTSYCTHFGDAYFQEINCTITDNLLLSVTTQHDNCSITKKHCILYMFYSVHK